jgi:hypothetical protein
MDGEVEVMLLRVGLSPQVLATAGLASNAVQTVFSAEQQDLEAATAMLASRDAACASAKREVDQLRRKVQSGQASPEEISQLAAAKTELAAATSSRDAFLAGILTGVCENTSAPARASIQSMIASKRWKTIPLPYRVAERTEAEWLQIRDAVAAKRTHEKFGDDVPAEVTQFLASLDADQGVAAAASNSGSCLAGVQALWDGVFSH